MGGPGGGGRGPGPSLMAPSSGGGRGPRLATPVARAWSLARQGRAEPTGPPGLTSVQLSRVRLRGCGSDFQVRVGDAGVSETLAHTAGGVARAATCPPARAPPPQGRGALRQHGRSPPSSAVYGHRRPSAMATRRPPRAGGALASAGRQPRGPAGDGDRAAWSRTHVSAFRRDLPGRGPRLGRHGDSTGTLWPERGRGPPCPRRSPGSVWRELGGANPRSRNRRGVCRAAPGAGGRRDGRGAGRARAAAPAAESWFCCMFPRSVPLTGQAWRACPWWHPARH